MNQIRESLRIGERRPDGCLQRRLADVAHLFAQFFERARNSLLLGVIAHTERHANRPQILEGDEVNYFWRSIHSTNWRGERILVP